MACFSAPLAQAIVVSVAKHGAKTSRNPFLAHLDWLQKMLFGGSFLLAIEHVWHGEIIPRFPFLTAVKDGNTAEMWHEIATVGVSMAVLITVVWVAMVGVSVLVERRAATADSRA